MRCFNKNISGATAIEYALIAMLIGIVIIVGIASVGTQLTDTYSVVGSSVESANHSAGE